MSERNGQEPREEAPLAEMAPHFTPTPDVVYDFWMPLLTGSEYKIVSYVLRKTYGWRKPEDAIPLSQFVTGQKRKDGSAIDHGTGLSRAQVTLSVRVLVATGILKKRHRTRPDESDTAPAYVLNLAWDFRTEGKKLAALRTAPPPNEDVPHPKQAHHNQYTVRNQHPPVLETSTPSVLKSSTPPVPDPVLETSTPPCYYLAPPETSLPETCVQETTTTPINRPALAGRKSGRSAAEVLARFEEAGSELGWTDEALAAEARCRAERGSLPPPEAACGAVGVVSNKQACGERDGDGTEGGFEGVAEVMAQPARLAPPRPLTAEEVELLGTIRALPDHDDPALSVSTATAEAIIRAHSEYPAVIRAMCKAAATKQNPIGWLKVALPKAIEASRERAAPTSSPRKHLVPLAQVRQQLFTGTYATPSTDPRDTPERLYNLLSAWEDAGREPSEEERRYVRHKCRLAFERNGIQP